MILDLTDEEAAALAKHLRQSLDYDRYPFAPRLDPLKAILAKLEPPKPQPQPLQPLPAGPGPASGEDGADDERLQRPANRASARDELPLRPLERCGSKFQFNRGQQFGSALLS